MGNSTKLDKEFIEGILDLKLTGRPFTKTKIYTTKDFRLDTQGMTSKEPQQHNLQVQVDFQTKITFLAQEGSTKYSFSSYRMTTLSLPPLLGMA
ncbi:hypothetical protein MMC17_004327 [Xylographa soralifera]|nr:hypothetical protein [Xylographa soralifera]